ncbi:MAG: glycosyltransferase family 2 protein [Deltaproteobacteria bacterium]|nr:glycosyltransferase family 2 protein [Deltaproteobacteria bacterium]
MYQGKKIAVLVPAYNEESLISGTIVSIPDFIDKIVVVNDGSKDRTPQIVEELALKDQRICLLGHDRNRGVGGAIATGYKWARDNEMDVAVVMAGDGQMDPADLPAILAPVVSGSADYSKGNRLFTGEAYKQIPKIRYFGNAALSLLTKIASGYWHVADSQTGYTAINRKALHMIDWDRMYSRYGQPNDLLARLNVCEMKVADVPVRPVYRVGAKSGIRIRRVVFSISWLLFTLFVWRLKEKYIVRNFHPLVFFYLLGALFFVLTAVLFTRLFWMWYATGIIPSINALAAMFCFMSSSLFTLFAMWFDMEYNKDLKG